MRSFIIKFMLALTLLVPAGFSFVPVHNVSAAIATLDPPTLNSPADGATGVSTSPTLDVTVTGPEGDPLSVTFYGRPVYGQDFTLIVLPDTQGYTDYRSSNGPAIFNSQTQWIVNNLASLNIAYVAHVGDVVQHGDNNELEWQRANTALGFLEDPATTGLPDGIPYGISLGNNDGSGTFYNKYFGIDNFQGRSYYGGYFEPDNNDNHYSLFSAGGMDFIVIDFQYGNVDSALLSWADQLLQDNSSRRAIVVTHHVIGSGNPATFSSQGLAIYEALKDNPNLFLLLGGHISGEGQREDIYNGSTVYSLLSDYQSRSNGGDGWLRMMEFSPGNDEIRVKTFSPWRNQYETDADSQFTLSYSMAASSEFHEIGTVSNVPSGSSASLTWPGLSSQTEYEWYVTVNDGSQETTGPTWSFTTAVDQNHAPTGISLTASSIPENQPSGSIVGSFSTTDPDEGDAHTYSLVSGSGDTDNLSFIIQDNRLQTNASFNYEVKKSYSIRVRAADSGGLSYNKTFTISVSNVNEAPTANDDAYSIEEDTPLVLPISGFGSPAYNDTDPDGDPLAVSDVSAAQGGTVQINGSTIDFTPGQEVCGQASAVFNYVVSDGQGGQDTGHVTIDITCINHLPASAEDIYTASEDSHLELPLTGPGSPVENDTDADGDSLLVTGILSSSGGNARISGSSIIFTPAADLCGPAAGGFAYTVGDGKGGLSDGYAWIDIICVNDPPKVVHDEYTIQQGSSIRTAAPGLLDNDLDPDGDSLTAILISQPVHGSLSLNPDGSFIYTPQDSFAGFDKFTYLASDGSVVSNTTDVTIQVLDSRNHLYLPFLSLRANSGSAEGIP